MVYILFFISRNCNNHLTKISKKRNKGINKWVNAKKFTINSEKPLKKTKVLPKTHNFLVVIRKI